MADQQTRRVVQIVIDASGAKKGEEEANRSLRSIKKHAKDTSDALSQLKAAFAAAFTFDTLRILGELSDTYRNVRGRLDLVLTRTRDVAQAQRDLIDIANQTQASYESTAALFVRVANTAVGAKQGYAGMLTFTRAVNDSLRVSGTNAKEASSGLIQLSQALQSGRLQGDELRSLMENSPRLIKAMADGLGVPAGALKQMGTDGKLLAKDVIPAIISQAEKLRKEAERLGPTFGGAWEYLVTSATVFTGQSKVLQGVVYGVTTTMRFLADHLWLVESALVAVGVVALPMVINGLRALTAAAMANPFTALAAIATMAAVAIYENWARVERFLIKFAERTPTRIANSFNMMWNFVKLGAMVAANGVIGAVTWMVEELINTVVKGLNYLPDKAKELLGIVEPLKEIKIDFKLDTGSVYSQLQALRADWKDLENGWADEDKEWERVHRKRTKGASGMPVLKPQGEVFNPPKPDKGRSPYESAVDQLGGDIAQLEFKISTFEKYGKAARAAEEAEMAFQTTKGKFEKLSAPEKAELMRLARRKDELSSTLEFMKVEDKLKDSMAEKLEAYKAETAAMDMASKAREKYLALAELDADFKRLSEGLNETQLAQLRAEYEERRKLMGLAIDERQAKEQDPMRAARKTVDDYVTAGLDSAAQIQQGLTTAFQASEDALMKFVTTGKAGFKDFVKVILQELARIMIARAIAGAVSWAFGAPSAGAAPVPGRATGGAVTPNSLYRVNERGPELLRYNNQTYLMTDKNGGYVAPFRAAADTGGGAGGNVTVNSNTSISVVNGEAKSSTQVDGPNGVKSIGRMIEQAVVDVIAREKRQGGVLYART